MDINNRIIENVNKRKERLNLINKRILNLSSKILALYNVNSTMRIVSPSIFPSISTMNSTSHHPHTSMFFDSTQEI